MSRRKKSDFLIRAIKVIALIMAVHGLHAQELAPGYDNSTITYPAEYFDQYEPLFVSDMIDRIPGINIARGGNFNNSSGPGSSRGPDRRGLGLGGDQVLINGRRIAGKENEASSQLSRIPANQVEKIEIIRGTSGNLDVRGGTQVINIVLREAESSSSFAYEFNADHYHDGRIKPGAKFSASGQQGNLDYLVSSETEPRWEYRKGFETSVLANGSLNEKITRDQTTDQQPIIFSSNLGYQYSANDLFHFNIQYEQNDAPTKEERAITSLLSEPKSINVELDDIENVSRFWEIGGDYEHIFTNGNRWKSLFITNRKEDDRLRERFDVDQGNTKNLFLETYNNYEEQIFRTSYAMNLSLAQDLEFGIERAQTTLDSSLKLALDNSTEIISSAFGGLMPVTYSRATVEEIRYETFFVHNWQLNRRMSLESTLILEKSTIKQTGDIRKQRGFDFVRPKFDFRFDITRSFQFRATVERDVAQLSFNDFTANTNTSDDDQNAIAGNPDIKQEQSWRYDINFEYRFNNDNGVVNTNLFYHDLEDVIEKVDVSTAISILSANGNIGDGERYGGSIDASLRLNNFNLPQVLLTSRVEVEDGNIRDPFLEINRRLQRQGRGGYSYGFRHDMISRDINYGINVSGSFQGDQILYDIDKIEDYYMEDFIIAFLEIQGWGGLTYRFEAYNIHEQDRCRIRSRYIFGTIATGVLNEIENSCSHPGEKYAIKIRGTF